MSTLRQIEKAMEFMKARAGLEDRLLAAGVDAILESDKTAEEKLKLLIEERFAGQAYEIAINCMYKVMEQMQGEEKAQEIKAVEEQKKTKRKPIEVKEVEIDTGKIIALANARWSSRKIADELGIKEQTVEQILNSCRK